MIVHIKRVERGWPGHFICASKCIFRRNTLLTSRKRHLIVSTVGNMQQKDEVIDTIGPNRYYETMCFVGKKDGPYIDINVTKEFHSFPDTVKWSINAKNAKSLPDDVDNQANDMHEAFVKWVTENFDFAYTKTNKRKEE